jgi:hypothetical protein
VAADTATASRGYIAANYRLLFVYKTFTLFYDYVIIVFRFYDGE